MSNPCCSVGLARRSIEFEMPVHVAAHVEASRPDAGGEMRVTVRGGLELSGAAAEWIVRFSNPEWITGPREVRTTASLLAPASEVEIPTCTLRGPVPEPLTVWLEFVDARGRRLCDRLYLGRRLPCERTVHIGLSMPVTATAATRMAARPKSRLEVRGDLRMSGLSARLAVSGDVSFPTNRPVSGPFTPRLALMTDVPIIPGGHIVSTARQLVPDHGPWDAWLWVQWRHGNGAPIGAEQTLGPCRQLVGIAAS